jgi:enediyne biosynthesis protein E5
MEGFMIATATATAKPTNRLGGLRRFAIAITAFNILGHTIFGFEQPWIVPFVAVLSAYACEIWFELVDAWAHSRKPRFLAVTQLEKAGSRAVPASSDSLANRGPLGRRHRVSDESSVLHHTFTRFSGHCGRWVDFLLSAHITGLACGMLLYSSSRLMPVVFASAVAITSKALLRVPLQNGSRHFLNPSNFGITAALLLFPWVGIAPPYHFTENIHGWGSWILPAIIVFSGSFLNAKFTRRICVAVGWVGGFAAQALLRNLVCGVPLSATLLPMTGVAFVLFTFYMVTDPATTPCTGRGQLLYGTLVSATYGLLVAMHVVFGFFFALTLVSLARGITLYAQQYLAARSPRGVAVKATAAFAREMA